MPGAIHFYLKEPQFIYTDADNKIVAVTKNGTKKVKPDAADTLIYLKFKYTVSGKKQVLLYYFDEKINPNHWDFGAERVKRNIVATTKDGRSSLNDLLDNLESELSKSYNRQLSTGKPPVSELKQHLDVFMSRKVMATEKPTFFKLADEFVNGDVLSKYGEKQSPNTIKAYKTVVNHLREFEKREKYPVDFSTIDLTFYRKYVNYLNKIGLGVNTRGKHIQVIKYIMGKALKWKYTTNTDFKDDEFRVVFKDVDAVYLTDSDILKFYRYDFSDNPRLEQARDLFVFGCYVGLRHGDYSNIKPENITESVNENGEKEYYIRIKTQKTGEAVVIPCNPVVMQIFEKYKSNPNKLPRATTGQRFNQNIKEAAEAAKLNEKGRLSSAPDQPLYSLISSHTARRSFATNLYNEGFPVYDLMKITGHKTEKNFLKYLKISGEQSGKKLMEHQKREWSKKLLRIA